MDPLINSFRENESVETFQQFLDSVAPACSSNAPAQTETVGQVLGEFLDTFAPIEQQVEKLRKPTKAKPPAARKTKTEVKRKAEPPKRPEKKIAKEPAKKKIKQEPGKNVEIPKVASINLEVYVCSKCCFDAHFPQQQQ